ncbi:MAG: hypothetical protein AAGG68_23930 [Bacteroidota bacterium]
MFSPDYLVICLLCFAAVILVIMKVVKEASIDDEDGGLDQWDDSFPLPDLPNGVVTMDELEKEKPSVLEEA